MVGILFRHPFAAVDLESHGQNVATVTHTLIDALSLLDAVWGGGGLGSSLGFAPQARARPVQRWHHTGEAGFTHRLHHQHREQILLRLQRHPSYWVRPCVQRMHGLNPTLRVAH
jgi:hypothetical protein